MSSANPFASNSYLKKKKDTTGPTDMNMYRRPEPNPFSKDWNEGYLDALDGKRMKIRGLNYLDGFRCGYETSLLEREELDRLASSNA